MKALTMTAPGTLSGHTEPDLFSTVSPARLRDEGMTQALSVDATDNDVIVQAIRSVGRAKGTVTANDVRDLLPVLASSNAVGAAFRALAVAGELVHDGYERASHPEGRCRPIVRWRYVTGSENSHKREAPVTACPDRVMPPASQRLCGGDGADSHDVGPGMSEALPADEKGRGGSLTPVPAHRS